MLRFLFSDSSVNAGTALFAMIAFLLSDMLFSSIRSFSQYFSFDVFVYAFSGTTHWANIIVKHAVPVLIGIATYLMLARVFVKTPEAERKPLQSSLISLEGSVAAGIFVATLIIIWPSLRFPKLLLLEYDFTLLVLSAFLFCLSFSISGLFGVRVGRIMWHPPSIEDHMPGSARVKEWRRGLAPLMAAIVTGVIGSLIATLAGA